MNMNKPMAWAAQATRRSGALRLLCLSALSAGPAAAPAADWNCVRDYWDIGGCWNPVGVPTAPADANVPSGIVDFDNITGGRSINIVNIGPATMNQTGGALAVTDDVRVGSSLGGPAQYTHSGGTLSIGDALLTGNAFEGTYTLSGTGSITANRFFIGQVVTGAVQQTGGSAQTTTHLTVGDIGTGTYDQSAGTVTVGTQLRLGHGAGGVGFYNLSGSADLATGSVAMGGSGIGNFNQTGGSHTVSGDVTFGFIGIYNLDGGSLTVGGNLLKGIGSTANVRIDGGALAIGSSGVIDVQNFEVGQQAGKTGFHVLTDSVQLETGATNVGVAGTGTFIQDLSSDHITFELNLGEGQNSNGTYTMLNGTLDAGDAGFAFSGVYIGTAGTGQFNHLAGTHTINSHLRLGLEATGDGIYDLRGGALSIAGDVINGAGASELALNGGTLSFAGGAGTIDVDSFKVGDNASAGFTLSNRDLVTATTTIGGSSEAIGFFTHSGAVAHATGTLSLGPIAGGQGVYELRAGTLDVAGSVTDGAGFSRLHVDGGTLAVDGNIALNILSIGNSFAGTYSFGTGAITTGRTWVGTSGNGEFVQTGGTHTAQGSLEIGRTPGMYGIYDLSGGTLAVGNIAGGKAAVGGRFENEDGVGSMGGGTGQFTISGDSLASIGQQLLVFTGGTVDLSGGTLELRSLDVFGAFNFNSGTLRYLGNTTLDAAELAQFLPGPTPTLGPGQHLAVADETPTITAPLRLNGGELSLSGLGAASGAFLDLSAGTLNITGSGLNVGNTGAFGPAFVTGVDINLPAPGLGRLTVAAEGDFRTAGNLSAFAIDNFGSAVHVGGNTIVSAVVNNNAGAQISVIGTGFPISYGNDPANASPGNAGGTLFVNAGDLVLSDVDFIVDYQALLGSTLTIIGDVDIWGDFSGVTDIFGPGTFTVSGNFNPGNSPTGMTVETDLALAGVTTSELGGLLAGTEYDQTTVEGTLTLGGRLDVKLIDDIEPGYAPEPGDAYTLFIAEAIVGEFNSMRLPSLGEGLRWSTAYSASALQLSVNAVPLPAAAWLLTPALVALRLAGRRRDG